MSRKMLWVADIVGYGWSRVGPDQDARGIVAGQDLRRGDQG